MASYAGCSSKLKLNSNLNLTSRTSHKSGSWKRYSQKRERFFLAHWRSENVFPTLGYSSRLLQWLIWNLGLTLTPCPARWICNRHLQLSALNLYFPCEMDIIWLWCSCFTGFGLGFGICQWIFIMFSFYHISSSVYWKCQCLFYRNRRKYPNGLITEG